MPADTPTPPNPLPCGCRVKYVSVAVMTHGSAGITTHHVQHCPQHAAAEQLHRAATRALALLKRTAWNAAPEVAELAASIAAAKGQVPHA